MALDDHCGFDRALFDQPCIFGYIVSAAHCAPGIDCFVRCKIIQRLAELGV